MRIPARMFAAPLTMFLCANVAGCTIVRTKEGATQADYNRDTYECQRDVRQSRVEDSKDAAGLYEQCLQAKGYTSTMYWRWKTPKPN